MNGTSHARFSEPGYAYGEHPNDFLRTACQDLPRGEALSLGEGEGRNAVYLARLGFRVTAVDFSAVALAKANKLAAAHGVSIDTLHADLADFEPGHERWDLIVSIFCQPPSEVRRRLYGLIPGALRSRGAFVLEAKAQAGATGADRYPGEATLRSEIGALRWVLAQEIERDLSEGRYHVGTQRVVQLFAVRD